MLISHDSEDISRVHYQCVIAVMTPVPYIIQKTGSDFTKRCTLNAVHLHSVGSQLAVGRRLCKIDFQPPLEVIGSCMIETGVVDSGGQQD